MKAGDSQRALKPRLRQLVDLLPKHEWIISRAAIELGYSKSYAQKRLPKRLLANDTFCVAMEAKRREFMEATGWDEKKWRQECIAQYERAKAQDDWPAICQLLKMLGQNTGSFEADNSQRRDQLAIENLDLDVYVHDHFVSLRDSLSGATGRFIVRINPRELLYLSPGSIRDAALNQRGDNCLAGGHLVPEAAEWSAEALAEKEKEARHQA